MRGLLGMLAVLSCGGFGGGWAVRYDAGVEPVPRVLEAVEAARAAAPCAVGREALSGGVIRFRAEPFVCGDVLAVGCSWWWVREYDIVWKPRVQDTALWDELGHAVWVACFNRTGESMQHAYDPDFAVWLEGLRRAW